MTQPTTVAPSAPPAGLPPSPDSEPPPPPPPGYEPPPPPMLHPPVLAFLGRIGLSFGGDVVTGNLPLDSSSQVRAGQLFSVALGGILQPGIWSIEATIGVKGQAVTSNNNSNDSISFIHVPLDIIASIAPGHHRFGIGVSVGFAGATHCSVVGTCSYDQSYDTAAGLILQYAYTLFSRRRAGIDFALRYTAIKFTSSDPSVLALDGSNLGFLIGLRY